MKFQSINDFKNQSIEKAALSYIYGGADVATEGGNNPVVGKYSADTKHDDGTRTLHTVTDKSTAPAAPAEPTPGGGGE